MRIWAILLLALPVGAQTPIFEVASIRPFDGTLKTGAFCRGIKPGTENIRATGITLNLLVIDAYEAEVDQFDLPDWGRATFDISAKMPPDGTVSTCRQMRRNLLAERFHMVTAVDNRPMPTYFLKVAKGGLKLQPVSGPPDSGTGVTGKSENGRTSYTFRGAPMSRIFNIIQGMALLEFRTNGLEADYVLDQTGLAGYYDGKLEFSPSSQVPAKGQLADAPRLQDAVVEQLGLTLELGKAPRKVLTIRSSDRTPTEN